MLALGLAAALLVALWRALRASHVLAVASVVAAAYGFAMDGANAVATRGRSENVYEGFFFVFLGPSGSLGRDRGVLPTSRFFVEHPLGVASPVVFFGVMDSVQIAMNVAISKLAE